MHTSTKFPYALPSTFRHAAAVLRAIKGGSNDY